MEKGKTWEKGKIRGKGGVEILRGNGVGGIKIGKKGWENRVSRGQNFLS